MGACIRRSSCFQCLEASLNEFERTIRRLLHLFHDGKRMQSVFTSNWPPFQWRVSRTLMVSLRGNLALGSRRLMLPNCILGHRSYIITDSVLGQWGKNVLDPLPPLGQIYPTTSPEPIPPLRALISTICSLLTTPYQGKPPKWNTGSNQRSCSKAREGIGLEYEAECMAHSFRHLFCLKHLCPSHLPVAGDVLGWSPTPPNPRPR